MLPVPLLLLCRIRFPWEVPLAAGLEGNFGRGRGLLQHCKAQHCNFSLFCAINALLVASPGVYLCGNRGILWHDGYDCSDRVWLGTDLMFHSRNFRELSKASC